MRYVREKRREERGKKIFLLTNEFCLHSLIWQFQELASQRLQSASWHYCYVPEIAKIHRYHIFTDNIGNVYSEKKKKNKHCHC